MRAFRYRRAGSLQEATSFLENAAEGRPLAGGQTLVPAMKTRLAAPGDLIDIRAIPELQGIATEGEHVVIGAASTHAEVATSPFLRSGCPALSKLAGSIGDPHVRHRGTIGGSLANNDPAADYPAAALALDATIVTTRREIAAADFFTGYYETALEHGEIIRAVRFRVPRKAGYAKLRNHASGFAVVGVFVAIFEDGIRAAVTGAGANGVFRSAKIEAALAERFAAEALRDISVEHDELASDIHASAAYRAALVVEMAKRAVSET